MKKFTKIVATIGPASSNPEIIRRLCDAGMNAARINFSHGDKETQLEYIKNIRKVDDSLSIILDTKGPEIRTGKMVKDPVEVLEGVQVILTNKDVKGTSKKIAVSYPYLKEIAIKTRILFDDGLVESEVIKKNGDELVVKILNSGQIGSGKKVTIQGYKVKLPFLTNDDKDDIKLAIDNDIRIIASSFVRSRKDVRELKDFLAKYNTEMMIFSKIEHADAVEKLDEILQESDGIMIARGDLGVELPLQEVPGIQEKTIRKCNRAGKPVIVATQMLESMREHPRPTRAEVSDIAHAILQGTDAIMLSAETATGKYPVRSVEMMSNIALQYEKKIKGIVQRKRRKDDVGRNEIAQYIAKAAYYASGDLNAKAILTPTETGYTARNVSRFKPKCPIIASTKSRAVFQQLQLSWGVLPMFDPEQHLNLSHDAMSYNLTLKNYEQGFFGLDDRIIITSGSKLMTKRGTNLLEIYNVGDILNNNRK